MHPIFKQCMLKNQFALVFKPIYLAKLFVKCVFLVINMLEFLELFLSDFREKSDQLESSNRFPRRAKRAHRTINMGKSHSKTSSCEKYDTLVFCQMRSLSMYHLYTLLIPFITVLIFFAFIL